MGRKIVITEDGSTSVFLEEMNEHYHSVHGARTESMHVFIEAGLNALDRRRVKLLEVGFGTGLNAYLSLLAIQGTNREIHYTGIEKFPLEKDFLDQMIFDEYTSPENAELLKKIHAQSWGDIQIVCEGFHLKKIKSDLTTHSFNDSYDLIYFDAFAPAKQPEMWKEDIFLKLADAMTPGAILVTYSASGFVKRNIESTGLRVEKLPGPPHKREMIRAIKP